MSLLVEKALGKTAKEIVFKIRSKVFVDEQNVPADKEYDQFEDDSFHFLASSNGKPVGAARWRFTTEGIKLERFAVLSEARGKGVGQALLTAVLRDIMVHPDAQGKMKYLNAQILAVPLYEKFGFKKVGDQFDECNIQHYRMELA